MALYIVAFASQGYSYPFGIKPAGANEADARKQYEAFMNKCVSGSSTLRALQGGKTTSEYQGYAMAFAAAVGDETRYAKLWKFAKKYIEMNHLKTMPWLIEGGRIAGAGSAMDGCIEIVYSLDMAEERWPGNGYGDEAKKYIGNLLARGQKWDGRWWWPDSNYILPKVKPGGMGYHANYMSFAWLPRFTVRSGDPRFEGPVTTAWWKLLEYSYENYALVGCSLMEDGRQSLDGNKGFCGVVGSGWNRFDAGPTRFAWRISMPYLLYGDERSKKWADKLTAFWVAKGGEEDIKNIQAGYNFTDGKCYWPDHKPTTISGAGANAMVSGNQKIADGAWEYCKNWQMTGNIMNDGAAVWGVLIMSGMLKPAAYDPADYTTAVEKPAIRRGSVQGTTKGFAGQPVRAYTISGRQVPVAGLEKGRRTGIHIIESEGQGVSIRPTVR
jgi:hypothetical protein